MKLTGLIICIFVAQSAFGQEDLDDEKGDVIDIKDQGEELDKRLKAVNVDNSDEVKATESYRCGVFYAGKLGEKPLKKLHIMPKRFKFDCTKPDDVLIKEVKAECVDLLGNVGKFITWQTTSRLRGKGFTFGDDVCAHLTFKSGIKRLPPSRRFPEGIPIGMYYNFCGKKAWYDTELRMNEPVCCKKNSEIPRYEACS